MKLLRCSFTTVFCSLALISAVFAGEPPPSKLSLFFTGRYTTGAGSGSAEISAYDPASKRLFVVNPAQSQLTILSLAVPSAPALIGSIPMPGAPNSVAVRNGVVAVAVEAAVRQNPGSVLFFNAASSASLGSAPVGAVPDMLTFTPDGTRVVVANEGEPNSYNQPDSVDPLGSVSIIDVTLGDGTIAIGSNVTVDFTSFNGQEAALRAQGIRIFGPNASAAQDFEPEYIAISPDSARGYVTLQENNAIATIVLATGAIESLRPLGTKNHNSAGNGIDPSDRDNANGTGAAISIRNVPVEGMYQPDAIATFERDGQLYYLTANEGDAREYTGFAEEARVSTLMLDEATFGGAANVATLKGNGPSGIGRLTVSTVAANTDGDADVDRLLSFGARSFSVWNATSGALVFDSGDDLEQLTASRPQQFLFNSDGSTGLDTRSDNKGPEPEGIVIGQAFGLTLGFVGLERTGDVVMYNLSDPAAPTLLGFFNGGADLGTEGLTFVSAGDSPTGEPLLVLTNEVSGTVTILTIAQPAVNAVSRKEHAAAGTFDIQLIPHAIGSPAIECRNPGPAGSEYRVVFTFPREVTYTGAVYNSATGGSVSGTPTSFNAIEVNLNLTGIANASSGEITLSNVNDGLTTSDVTVPIRFLLGDTNGNASVNSGDALQTRNRSGQSADTTNFRSDVNLDGNVNSGDASIVRAQSGGGF